MGRCKESFHYLVGTLGHPATSQYPWVSGNSKMAARNPASSNCRQARALELLRCSPKGSWWAIWKQSTMLHMTGWMSVRAFGF